jgi:hypothetical protein
LAAPTKTETQRPAALFWRGLRRRLPPAGWCFHVARRAGGHIAPAPSASINLIRVHYSILRWQAGAGALPMPLRAAPPIVKFTGGLPVFFAVAGVVRDCRRNRGAGLQRPAAIYFLRK